MPTSPYGAPPQSAYGEPPQSPYGTPPQNPYGAPPQSPYGTPPQSPYGAPPQSPYGAPTYNPTPTGGAYPWPAYGQPPPKKRSGGKIAIVVIAVVVVIALCAGGAIFAAHSLTNQNTASKSPTTGTSTPTPSASPSSSPSASPKPTTPGAILYSKIVKPPAGSKNYTLKHGTKGIFTATQIADQTFTHPTTEAGWLKANGFVVAAGRDYARPDGVQILVYLLQFKTSSGARSEYQRVRGGRQDDKTVSKTFAVPGGAGYEWTKVDQLGNRRSEMYKVVGNVVIFLNVYTPGTISVSQNLSTLSTQAAALTQS
jgi:hypothetical protein